jgi:hypothetical protein
MTASSASLELVAMRWMCSTVRANSARSWVAAGRPRARRRAPSRSCCDVGRRRLGRGLDRAHERHRRLIDELRRDLGLGPRSLGVAPDQLGLDRAQPERQDPAGRGLGVDHGPRQGALDQAGQRGVLGAQLADHRVGATGQAVEEIAQRRPRPAPPQPARGQVLDEGPDVDRGALLEVVIDRVGEVAGHQGDGVVGRQHRAQR